MATHQCSANAEMRARKLGRAGLHETFKRLGKILLYAIAGFISNAQ